MSARITKIGSRIPPRKGSETPTFLFQEWPEHVGRCCEAIRKRRRAEILAETQVSARGR